jgi:hypothetical protein
LSVGVADGTAVALVVATGVVEDTGVVAAVGVPDTTVVGVRSAALARPTIVVIAIATNAPAASNRTGDVRDARLSRWIVR